MRPPGLHACGAARIDGRSPGLRALAGVTALAAILASAPWAKAQSLAQGSAGSGVQAPGGATTTNGSGGASAPAAGAQDTGSATVPSGGIFPYGFAPPAPGQPVGGGNATESSARPVQGDKEDGFDLGPRAGGGGGGGGEGGTVTGDANGPIFLEPQRRRSGAANVNDEELPANAPGTVVVRKGDTLWSLCGTYFQNPYAWPKVWSYNPQIKNPHWIQPNDVVRLRAGAPLDAQAATVPAGPGGRRDPNKLVLRNRSFTPGTVYLRDEGYVDDTENLQVGTIAGSREDKMFLSDFDEAYVEIAPGHERDVQLGQELTVYRPARKVKNGEVIVLQGTLKVDAWDPKTRIARAQVTETLDAIERGARVGNVPRTFEMVPPVQANVAVRVHVLVAVRPHEFFGQNQIVFIDAGSAAGLRPGNRLFIVRRGDAWRGTMGTDRTADRVPIEDNSIGVVERTPRLADESRYPEEVIGELRVLNVQRQSATCYVTETRREIEVNDEAVSRDGY